MPTEHLPAGRDEARGIGVVVHGRETEPKTAARAPCSSMCVAAQCHRSSRAEAKGMAVETNKKCAPFMVARGNTRGNTRNSTTAQIMGRPGAGCSPVAGRVYTDRAAGACRAPRRCVTSCVGDVPTSGSSIFTGAGVSIAGASSSSDENQALLAHRRFPVPRSMSYFSFRKASFSSVCFFSYLYSVFGI